MREVELDWNNDTSPNRAGAQADRNKVVLPTETDTAWIASSRHTGLSNSQKKKKEKEKQPAITNFQTQENSVTSAFSKTEARATESR